MYKTHREMIRRNTEICQIFHLMTDMIITYIFTLQTYQYIMIITYKHMYPINLLLLVQVLVIVSIFHFRFDDNFMTYRCLLAGIILKLSQNNIVLTREVVSHRLDGFSRVVTSTQSDTW